MTTPTSVFMSSLKETKNGTLAKQTLEAIDLIYGMYTQLDFGNNVGGIPPGYTFSHTLICKKIFQLMLGRKELDQRTHFNIYIFLQMLVSRHQG